jgi:hypothetical protein
MMKRLAIVGVAFVVFVGIGSCRKPPVAQGNQGRGNQAKPKATEAQLSPELQEYLYAPYSTLNIAATDIHDYTRYQEKSGLFGQKGLKYLIDPDVTGRIEVYGHGITWASALDGFCKANGCKWAVTDPYTIRISRMQSAN